MQPQKQRSAGTRISPWAGKGSPVQSLSPSLQTTAGVLGSHSHSSWGGKNVYAGKSVLVMNQGISNSQGVRGHTKKCAEEVIIWYPA